MDIHTCHSIFHTQMLLASNIYMTMNQLVRTTGFQIMDYSPDNISNTK